MASSSKYVGPFFPGKEKKDLVDFDTKYFDPALKQRVMDYVEQAKHGPVIPLAAQFGKSELLDLDKVEAKMPRIINGHDLAYNIFLRMITGEWVDAVNTHPTATPACTGINPLSHEWGQVAQCMAHGNILAGDLKKEEATTNRIMQEAFCTHLDNFYVLTPEEKIIQLNGLAGLNGYFFEYNGFVYYTLKGHSSGHILTTHYNTFCVWVLHKTAFEDVYTPDEAAFEEEVLLEAMGDDSLGSVSDKCAEKYHMVHLAEFATRAFGMKYTSGVDKKAELTKFIERDQATFLGRSFRSETVKDATYTMGPLRTTSINDLLIWSLPVPGLTPAQVDTIRIDQAMREASVHGKEYYEAIANKVRVFYTQRHQYCPYIPNYRVARRSLLANWHKSDLVILFDGKPCKKALSV